MLLVVGCHYSLSVPSLHDRFSMHIDADVAKKSLNTSDQSIRLLQKPTSPTKSTFSQSQKGRGLKAEKNEMKDDAEDTRSRLTDCPLWRDIHKSCHHPGLHEDLHVATSKKLQIAASRLLKRPSC